MPFTVATYNVLATAYLDRGTYRTPKHLLDPAWRVPALVRHVEALGADLLCLQEVEADVFAALDQRLSQAGYAGRYEWKGRGKPDGCATFFRQPAFALGECRRLEYADREKGPQEHSGFIALLLALEHAGRRLGVANTHLRWDRPGTARHAQVGHRQAVELLDVCAHFAPACEAWVICGDFNRQPNGEVIATFRQAGYEHAHAGRPHVRSCVANGRATLLDYIFFTQALRARPINPPEVDGHTVLPSAEQPSDHLALVAELSWAPPPNLV